MALFYECMERCAHIVLDIADIVRDGDVSPTTRLPVVVVTYCYAHITYCFRISTFSYMLGSR